MRKKRLGLGAEKHVLFLPIKAPIQLAGMIKKRLGSGG
jgi:hypothetical protein